MTRRIFVLAGIVLIIVCATLSAGNEKKAKTKINLKLILSVNAKTFDVTAQDKLVFTVKWKNTGKKKITIKLKDAGNPHMAFKIKGKLNTCIGIGYGIPSPDQGGSTVDIKPGKSLSCVWEAVARQKTFNDGSGWQTKWFYNLNDDDHRIGFGGGTYKFTATSVLEDSTILKSNTVKIKVVSEGE